MEITIEIASYYNVTKITLYNNVNKYCNKIDIALMYHYIITLMLHKVS